MAVRRYLAPIIGDGKTPATAFRPNVPQGFSDCSGYIPSGPDGKPLQSWALIDINTQDHTPFLNAPQLSALPDVATDAVLAKSDTDAISAALQKQGVVLAIQPGVKMSDVLVQIKAKADQAVVAVSA